MNNNISKNRFLHMLIILIIVLFLSYIGFSFLRYFYKDYTFYSQADGIQHIDSVEYVMGKESIIFISASEGEYEDNLYLGKKSEQESVLSGNFIEVWYKKDSFAIACQTKDTDDLVYVYDIDGTLLKTESVTFFKNTYSNNGFNELEIDRGEY